MARTQKIKKEDVLHGALAMARKIPFSQIGVRSLARSLSVSTQPILLHYPTLDCLRRELLLEVQNLFRMEFEKSLAQTPNIPYKAVGTAYIRFALKEPMLFELLFLNSDHREMADESFRNCVDLICEQKGLERSEATGLHLKSWIFVHGVATLVAKGALNLSEEEISELLSEHHRALELYYQKKKEEKA